VSARRLFAGVDVGGRRKGFHIAVLDEERNVVDQRCETAAGEAARFLAGRGVSVVAVDSPLSAAEPGEHGRRCEHEFLARKVCGIRLTPDEATVRRAHATDFYGWIINGWELYKALGVRAHEERWEVVECFPTATWTILYGRRPRGVSRAAWSRHALDHLPVKRSAGRLNQDQRDALAAAYTAWLHGRGETEPTFARSVCCRVPTFGVLAGTGSTGVGSAHRPALPLGTPTEEPACPL
jgi:predicted nuclease with RNAse H fold